MLLILQLGFTVLYCCRNLLWVGL